jgi:hypothetical protein
MSTEQIRPKRTSTLLAVAVGLAAVAALFNHSSVPRLQIGMSLAGILSLVLCLSLVERTPTRSEIIVVSLLAVPVAVGFVGGILGTSLALVGAQFPVPTDAQISVAILRVTGNVGIVVGAGIAVFGLVLGYRNVLAADPLTRYTRIVFVTAVVPLVTGVALFVRVVVSGNRRAAESLFGEVIGQLRLVLFTPEPTRLHLGSFLFVLTIAGGASLLFCRRAPVAELLPGEHSRNVGVVASLQRVLYVTVTVSAALMAGAVLLEVLLPPRELEARLGTGLFETIQLVTTAGWLRLLLWAVAVAAVVWLVTEFVLGRVSERAAGTGTQWLGPLAGGAVLTVLASVTSGPIFNRTLSETTSRLPTPFAARLQDIALPVANVYGESALVVLSTGALLAITAWIALGLRLAVSFDYLSNEGAGFSIASAGLLTAAVSVSTLAPPRWLLLGAIAAALVVWDLGRFGTALGREVGRSDTGGVELVHAGATLGVGALAVAAAALLESRAAGSSFDPDPTVTLALVSLAVALVAGSLALRDAVPDR